MTEYSSLTFAYRAAGGDGHVHSGVLEAATLDDARAAIRARGWFAITLRQRGSSAPHRARLAADELALGLRVLADLLDAGLPVARALQAFGDLAPRPWQPAIPALAQAVREGKSLATALADSSIAVPPLVVGIVRAGEAGPGLAAGMRRAAELTHAAAQTRAAVHSALAYPLVVGAAGAAAVTILVTVVLPRFAAILADLDQTLPPSTRAVIALASWAHAAALPAVFAGGVGATCLRAWTSTERGERAWHRVLLRVPVLGAVRRAHAVARIAQTLGALVDSGVSMTAALPFAARAAADSEMMARVTEARGLVLAGHTLSSALERVAAATPTAVRLVRAGEETGQLASMLGHAARLEQQRADRIVQTGVRMLEPVLLLIFASIVALIAAALLQAIYSVRPAI
jgi:type II secretory pathway component PulF